MSIKNFIRKLILGYKCDSESFLNHHRQLGARIGKRTKVFEPTKTVIDETRPFLIEIGDDVQITRGVTILTHGYDWSVLKGVYGEVLGSAGRVKIGNNVFIGMDTMILKGVTIGNNVIIGAKSVVNKDVPDNCVYAGNPARFICTLDQYYEKRKAAQLKEAKAIYDNYIISYGKEPDPVVFGEFFWLFHRRTEPLLNEFKRRIDLVGNGDLSLRIFKEQESLFDGYEAFLEYLKNTTVEQCTNDLRG